MKITCKKYLPVYKGWWYARETEEARQKGGPSSCIDHYKSVVYIYALINLISIWPQVTNNIIHVLFVMSYITLWKYILLLIN